jgi:hypothetical protein
MTAQRALWDDDDLTGMARDTDPDTSWMAAADAFVNADTDRARALAELRAHPEGLTDFELGALMGRQQTSAGKRRGELRDQGLVVNSGSKRSAPSGSLAIVWKAVDISRAHVSAVISARPSAVRDSRGDSEIERGDAMGSA